MATPQNDIKTEESRWEDRLGDAEKQKRKCDHCGKTGHSREKCLKLQGRPTQGRGSGRSGTTKSHGHKQGFRRFSLIP